MPTKILPEHPSLENLRKRAKGLARTFRQGDPAAIARVQEFHPRPPEQLPLADAQLVIAREYGLPSWPGLVRHLALDGPSRELHHADLFFQSLPDVRTKTLTLRDLLEREAAALFEAHRQRHPAAAGVLRLHGPWEKSTRRSGADALFRQALTLDQARDAIAGFHRFASWADVVADGDRPVDPLFEAAADAVVAGDAETLRSLLARQPALATSRSPFRHRSTLLHYVAANGVEEIRQWQSPPNAPEIAQILLDAGADPDATCPCYGPADTPLYLLVTSGHPAGAGVQAGLVETLCRGGAKPDGIDDDGRPLWEAVKFQYAPAAERLAACGARVDNIVCAAAVGDLPLVRKLCDEGRLDWGRSRAIDLPLDHPLEYALIFGAAHGRLAVVEFLVERKPDLTVEEPFWHGTALGAARFHGRAEVVAVLEARR